MEKKPIKWIWQHDAYPNFKYDKETLLELLTQIEYNKGVLDGVSKMFIEKDIKNIKLETLLNEAINTSEIEGEYLKIKQVFFLSLAKITNLIFYTQEIYLIQRNNKAIILHEKY